ncbi:hypothetical protein PAPHI01_0550 [Pancytospora philotis]|nr:hypothetical protein PAPHI01_0550 [Pancytospora philotis]
MLRLVATLNFAVMPSAVVDDELIAEEFIAHARQFFDPRAPAAYSLLQIAPRVKDVVFKETQLTKTKFTFARSSAKEYLSVHNNNVDILNHYAGNLVNFISMIHCTLFLCPIADFKRTDYSSQGINGATASDCISLESASRVASKRLRALCDDLRDYFIPEMTCALNSFVSICVQELQFYGVVGPEFTLPGFMFKWHQTQQKYKSLSPASMNICLACDIKDAIEGAFIIAAQCDGLAEENQKVAGADNYCASSRLCLERVSFSQLLQFIETYMGAILLVQVELFKLESQSIAFSDEVYRIMYAKSCNGILAGMVSAEEAETDDFAIKQICDAHLETIQQTRTLLTNIRSKLRFRLDHIHSTKAASN